MSDRADLGNFSDEELQREILRRQHERAVEEKRVRKAREVLVDCPVCGGTGRVRNSDVMRVAAGEANEWLSCYQCKGRGAIHAYKR